MEHFEFEFSGAQPVNPDHARPDREFSLAGVVGSGNLEVMIEPASIGGLCRAVIDTSVRGFDQTWRTVLADFFERQPLANVIVTINDGGATPAVVALRLDQASSAFIQQERLS